MKKVLFVASVSGHIRTFHLPYLEYFKQNGYIVDVASNGEMELSFCDNRHQIDFRRNPFRISNFKAYKNLKILIRNGNYDVIHCHTPVAAIMTRLAARRVRKKGTKVLYTAHGFHFFNGAPKKNWLIYFSAEWFCSFFTDMLLTMNMEDYQRAKKYMHAKKIVYVPGVGINTLRFPEIEIDKNEKRRELGVPDDCVMLLSVGELIARKNHKLIMDAMAKMKRDDLHFCVAGRGEEEFLLNYARKLEIEDRIHILGRRTDINEIMRSADVFCFPSFQEGLPVSLMEAMYVGVPIICSDIRGSVDLIEEDKGGFMFSPYSSDGLVLALEKMLCCENQSEMIKYNKNKVQKFTIDNVKKEMIKLYESIYDKD